MDRKVPPIVVCRKLGLYLSHERVILLATARGPLTKGRAAHRGNYKVPR
jgi:hypothetical protein